ncbi:hypothetical protein BGZ65_007507 [Modicella reniformis]|uniref:Uncharacterized protein n=1 Tax=Modicella reniformis TaxID=1440133 RepID=A0A9P6IJE1_9FUNG|nr:hypothetical protein BGZ65_007507 [Modicella reniformis]
MNQPPIVLLSSVLGNDTVAGIMAMVSLVVDAITGVNNEHKAYMMNQGYDQDSHFQSVFMSTLAAAFSAINSRVSSFIATETPLKTYLLVAVLSYVAYRIISWIVRSVLNLIKTSIIISIVMMILWFIINITSGGDDGVDSGNRQHQDPISQVLHGLQCKFRARQQQYLQQQHL